MPYKSFFNWSGGKDSSLALYYALKDAQYSIEKLLTNIDNEHRRISMHGVREELLEQQAASIGIPLQKLILPNQPSMTEYEKYTMQMLTELKEQKFSHSLFGDIFLEDLKIYRERQLEKLEITAVFPLWKRDTTQLINEFIDLGFKTMVVCVKAELLDESFAGRIIDKQFLQDLPANVDPCGENGEFHTFVFDGPIFNKPVRFELGEKVFRKYKAPADASNTSHTDQPSKSSNMGFWFCDLVPK